MTKIINIKTNEKSYSIEIKHNSIITKLKKIINRKKNVIIVIDYKVDYLLIPKVKDIYKDKRRMKIKLNRKFYISNHIKLKKPSLIPLKLLLLLKQNLKDKI